MLKRIIFSILMLGFVTQAIPVKAGIVNKEYLKYVGAFVVAEVALLVSLLYYKEYKEKQIRSSFTQEDLEHYVTKNERVLVVFTYPFWFSRPEIENYKKILDNLKDDSIKVVYVHAESEVGINFDIFAVPTTLFFYQGKLVNRRVCPMSLEELQKDIAISFKMFMTCNQV